MKRPVYVALFLLMLYPLTAQEIITSPEEDPEEQQRVISRVLGNQYLNIALGLQIPLFIHNPNPPAGTPAVQSTNLNLGGSLSVAWAIFLENSFSLGLDVSAAFSGDLNDKSFFTVPITLHANYFFRFFPFELPIHLGLGLNIIGYNEIVTTGLLVKAGTSFYWNAFEDWSFGLNVMYWWQPELYSDDDPNTPPASMSRLGNFLEITLSAMYNF